MSVYTRREPLLSWLWLTAYRELPFSHTALEYQELRIAIGSDHAGFDMKTTLVEILGGWGHQVDDHGPELFDADDDYPDYALAVAASVASGNAERGLLVCGSGVGASVAANKVRGVRAAMCHDTYSAHQGVEHDDMNVLCLGARIIGIELAKELIKAFLLASFSRDERHQRRLNKVLAAERQ